MAKLVRVDSSRPLETIVTDTKGLLNTHLTKLATENEPNDEDASWRQKQRRKPQKRLHRQRQEKHGRLTCRTRQT